ncbi:prolidase [Cantharellus anzutake]|uniref:prolidase n=1 Tax=Cantharellus anzutake TaxID=1750568 RepID=UPI0019050940|nr:prolidase [Cantharellus anzutake]KAF8331868.1 prolidase [Cantharellus anzutake]
MVHDHFPADIHASKTVAELGRLLSREQQSKGQIIYLQSQPVTYRNDTDRELNFRQESNFYYLTGCDIPASALLVLIPPPKKGEAFGRSVQSTLLIPEEDPLEIIWSPPPPTIEQAKTTHPAMSSVQYTRALPKLISLFIKNYPDALIQTLPVEKAFPPPLESFLSIATKNRTSEFLLSALHRARLTKTPHEISLIRKANAVSSRAHELIMRMLGEHAHDDIVGNLPDGKLVMPNKWRIEKEAEAEAAFVASCRREGSLHQAYLPIVAGAERAATLHYCCNDKDFAWGPVTGTNGRHHGLHRENGTHAIGPGSRLAPQVLLLDAGCEWKNYASDITRTIPVGNGGKFTEAAKEIYSLVLKMQNDAIAMLKPGVHWDRIHYQCHVTLVKSSLNWTAKSASASALMLSFFPHGLGHSIGLDVHDVPSASKPINNDTIPADSNKHPNFYAYLRLRLPLQAGMVLTVEPGVYFSPYLLAPHRNSPYINTEVLNTYETVGGVRIEDVLVITETGFENLTAVDKDIDWIEAVCGGHK